MTDNAPAAQNLRDFLGTFAFTKRDMPDIATVPPENIGLLAQELGWRALLRGRLDMLTAGTRDSWFSVVLNGVPLELPHYTMMTMRHCILASVDPTIAMLVETDHSDRMFAAFGPNTLFLDVGASTGAMSVPYALRRPEGLRIVAFEPSRRARSYLEATIARNGARNVTVLPYAVSDAAGNLEFMEMPEDETGSMPYLPEASRLQTSGETPYKDSASYSVDVRTLDSLARELRMDQADQLVVKIDVEGFEDKVLLGARDMLQRLNPFLSIDIHVHPGTQVLTDAACAAILQPMGYSIERLGHVMLAQKSV
jgi:FkbM family methyltransferase